MKFAVMKFALGKNSLYSQAFYLKSSRNKKDLNDVTAAPFLMSFSQLPAAKKNTKKGAAVTSLRLFLFRDDFRTFYKVPQLCKFEILTDFFE